MIKFLVIVVAAIAFGYFAYINFDDAFGEDIRADNTLNSDFDYVVSYFL